MKPNRRAILGAGLAGATGLITLAAPKLGAHTGTLADERFRDLAFAPETGDEYLKLARHVRKLAWGAESDARLYTELARVYRRGMPGATAAQATGTARAIEHAAQHNVDIAEALLHLAEHYEGIAESFQDVASG